MDKRMLALFQEVRDREGVAEAVQKLMDRGCRLETAKEILTVEGYDPIITTWGNNAGIMFTNEERRKAYLALKLLQVDYQSLSFQEKDLPNGILLRRNIDEARLAYAGSPTAAFRLEWRGKS